MAGTLVLTDTISKTFDGLFTEAYAGTDAYVRTQKVLDGSSDTPPIDASVLDTGCSRLTSSDCAPALAKKQRKNTLVHASNQRFVADGVMNASAQRVTCCAPALASSACCRSL